MGRQVEYRGKLTPVLGITDVLPYSTLQGCYQVLERCKKTYFKALYRLCKSPQASVSGRRQRRFDRLNRPLMLRRRCAR